ncbi:MAG: hypothetical protein H6779_03095 [Candidatus Nomurabacteria bacterium]|nr:MAG: hypothetical protein H6779_03095 [Candidatus Nomurabacteria bacterium]
MTTKSAFLSSIIVCITSILLVVFFTSSVAIAQTGEEEMSSATTTETSLEDETASVSTTTLATTTSVNSGTSSSVESAAALNPSTVTPSEFTLSKSKQQRVTNLAANISNRMEAAMARHENIIKRLNSRLSKMEQSGLNTDAAKVQLETAVNTLAEAKSSIQDIDKLVYNTVTSVTPKVEWLLLRDTYVNTAELIRETQAELSDTVTMLKTATLIPDEVDDNSLSSSTEFIE